MLDNVAVDDPHPADMSMQELQECSHNPIASQWCGQLALFSTLYTPPKCIVKECWNYKGWSTVLLALGDSSMAKCNITESETYK